MSGLPYQWIKSCKILYPFEERTEHEDTNTTFGCGAASYDVRLDQDIYLLSGYMTLASTLEHFTMPADVFAVVHDKSSLVRAGIVVQNTFIDPGWSGYLTLEISYHEMCPWKSEEEHRKWFESEQGPKTVPAVIMKPNFYKHDIQGITLKAGTPIAQIAFHRLVEPTERPYEGHYQMQRRGAVPSKFIQK